METFSNSEERETDEDEEEVIKDAKWTFQKYLLNTIRSRELATEALWLLDDKFIKVVLKYGQYGEGE